MIGAAIGGALKIGGAIAGGIMGAKSARKQARMIAGEKKKNQAWFDRRYNEDSTQRAEAQAAITKMRETMKDRTAAAAGTAAVMGGTEESMAIEKETQNKAMADTMSTIAVNGEARKDSIEAQYQARDAQLSQMQLENEQQKLNSITGAIGGVTSAGGGMDGELVMKSVQSMILGEPDKDKPTAVPPVAKEEVKPVSQLSSSIMPESATEKIVQPSSAIMPDPVAAAVNGEQPAGGVGQSIQGGTSEQPVKPFTGYQDVIEAQRKGNMPTEEELKKERKRERARSIIAAIADGTSAIANL